MVFERNVAVAESYPSLLLIAVKQHDGSGMRRGGSVWDFFNGWSHLRLRMPGFPPPWMVKAWCWECYRAIVKGWRDDGGRVSLVSQNRVKIEEERVVRNAEESIRVRHRGMVVDGGEVLLERLSKVSEHGSIPLNCK